MKKRLLLFFSALFLLGGMLMASSGDSRKVRAATPSLQTAKGVIIPLARPPAKMCVGEKALVSAIAESLLPARGTHITATASGGTLTKMDWRYPNGWMGVKLLLTTFKATEAGEGSISFRMEEGGTPPLNYPFEILDCKYEITISAITTDFSDTVSYQMTVEGNGEINASKDSDSLSGSGKYSVSIDAHYKNSSTGVTCVTISPSKGQGSFKVTGSRSGTVLNISVNLDALTLSGASFKCEDENGRETDVPRNLVIGGNTAAYALTGLTITPGVAKKFPFGSKGRGSLCVIPRSES